MDAGGDEDTLGIAVTAGRDVEIEDEDEKDCGVWKAWHESATGMT